MDYCKKKDCKTMNYKSMQFPGHVLPRCLIPGGRRLRIGNWFCINLFTNFDVFYWTARLTVHYIYWCFSEKPICKYYKSRYKPIYQLYLSQQINRLCLNVSHNTHCQTYEIQLQYKVLLLNATWFDPLHALPRHGQKLLLV